MVDATRRALFCSLFAKKAAVVCISIFGRFGRYWLKVRVGFASYLPIGIAFFLTNNNLSDGGKTERSQSGFRPSAGSGFVVDGESAVAPRPTHPCV